MTPEPNQTSVKVLFLKALSAEGPLTPELKARLADPAAPIPDNDDSISMLLAISDNGTEMRGDDTRKFMALMSIAQHFGRPSTPTDQAWIETLWGHLKWEHLHLLGITGPAILIAELERLRHHYNMNRPHTGIGLHTPASVQYGTATEIRDQRAATLDAAYTANPDRFRGRRPTPPKLPTGAWINDPSREANIHSK